MVLGALKPLRKLLEEGAEEPAEEEEEEEPTVTFPDDYPNSVRHFLLIGFLGMFIGAIVFFYMGISRK
eukprot:2980991-Rhodomonas_salina.1